MHLGLFMVVWFGVSIFLGLDGDHESAAFIGFIVATCVTVIVAILA